MQDEEDSQMAKEAIEAEDNADSAPKGEPIT
jgi:hypothetical protein